MMRRSSPADDPNVSLATLTLAMPHLAEVPPHRDLGAGLGHAQRPGKLRIRGKWRWSANLVDGRRSQAEVLQAYFAAGAKPGCEIVLAASSDMERPIRPVGGPLETTGLLAPLAQADAGTPSHIGPHSILDWKEIVGCQSDTQASPVHGQRPARVATVP